MYKEKNIKKFLLLMLATIIVSSSLIQFSVAEDDTIDVRMEPIKVFFAPPHLHNQNNLYPMKASGWPQIYDKGIEDSGSAIAIDSEGNIIVTGYTGYISNTTAEDTDFLTIKYDIEGNEIWNVTYNSGTFDYAWDVALDSSDNVIVYGFNWTNLNDLENMNIYIRVVKYNKDGIKQWDVIYHKDISHFPGGVSVDSQDNIVFTGGYGDFDNLEFFAWTTKLDSNGAELWSQTFTEDLISIGNAVTVDSNDNILVGGFAASFFAQGYIIIKYDSNGNKVSVHRYKTGTQPNALTLDQNENIILTGYNFYSSGQTNTWLIMKCNKQGALLWTREYNSGGVEHAEDVAVDSQGNIITVGISSFNGDFFEHCAIVYDKNGNEICMKRPDIDGVINGVAIDSNDNIYITGTVNQSYDYVFYTDRYEDLIPPSVNLIKPEEEYLYLFNIKLFPTSRNTVILGKLTVILEADNPSDVSKVEFYIDNVLKHTTTELDHAWTWSGGKILSKRVLKVMAYDESGSIAKYEILIWKPL
jgi:hypothetical protein